MSPASLALASRPSPLAFTSSFSLSTVAFCATRSANTVAENARSADIFFTSSKADSEASMSVGLPGLSVPVSRLSFSIR